ncbi:P-loop containing nucleoside triphosphate hydrolase protein [Sporodiniella umbellata]|nr:P-loop containing nucleoside triphosphate hydrolase protein [Sporodiniella umbellata]
MSDPLENITSRLGGLSTTPNSTTTASGAPPQPPPAQQPSTQPTQQQQQQPSSTQPTKPAQQGPPPTQTAQGPPPTQPAQQGPPPTQQSKPTGNETGEENLIKSTHTVQVKLADQQADPNSPLFSVKSFEELGLSPELLKGLYSMNFSKPSKIQERALPLLISNPPKNMIGQSQSGTGKTAAFVLTMLTRLVPGLNVPQAICLAPSRELARQIMDVVQAMSKFTNITTKLVVKDSVRRGETIQAQVIVGTPGTVMDVIKKRTLPVQAIKIFVLDEADNMLDQDGLGDQSIRVKNSIKGHPQVVLFSATFPDNVRRFAVKFAPDANEISLKREDLSVDAIKQFYMDCDNQEHKYNVLCNVYDLLTVSQSIIFCKQRHSAEEIGKRMKQQGHSVATLHGKMTPEERDKAMDDFRRGEYKVLVTTNVIARGIDISQVSLVINYDLPVDQRNAVDFEAYLHRIGRTGRFGRTGVSIILVDSKESWDQMREIENHFQRAITYVPTKDWELVEQQLKSLI